MGVLIAVKAPDCTGERVDGSQGVVQAEDFMLKCAGLCV